MITLTNFEIQLLQFELAGGNEKVGLLNEEIKFATKNKLENFLEELIEKFKNFSKAEKELLTKFGATEKDGLISLNFEKLTKEVQDEFVKERVALSEVSYEFNYGLFDEEVMNFTSKSRYPIFGKHLIKK